MTVGRTPLHSVSSDPLSQGYDHVVDLPDADTGGDIREGSRECDETLPLQQGPLGRGLG